MENAWNLSKKVGKTWNLNLNPGKKLYISKFGVLRFIFQKVIYKIFSFTSLSSTQTLSFEAKLIWDFIAFTWKYPQKYMEFHATREL